MYIEKQRVTDIENKLVVTSVEGEGGGSRQWHGIKRYKLLCIK